MVEIVWTNNALSDLNDIGDYIAKDSLKYAEITVSALFESVDILELNPYSGGVVPEFNKVTIRQIIRGNYRLIYKVASEDKIEVLTVHHCARLISNTNPFKK